MSNGFLLISMLLCLPFAGFASGETNRYSAIWGRNAFAIKAPLVVTNPTLAPVLSTPVKLTGIASIPPQKWALLQIQEPGKSPMPVALREGAREAALEVREIDARSKWVIVRNAGLLMTLTFENNGVLAKHSQTAHSGLESKHLPLPTMLAPEAGER